MIENLIKCPACFWLERAAGVKYPSIPGFLLNSNTDTLLKKDFDQYRGKGPHPIMESAGLSHLRPFAHEDIQRWENSLHFGASPNHFNTIHQETNLKFGGGLDDVWENTNTGQLHIVDYKSTSQKTEGREISLEDKWKGAYKRQMDLYVWVLRQKGFEVSDTGYFLYCDGDRFTDQIFLREDDAQMRFKMSLLPYDVSTDWIEPTLMKIKKLLGEEVSPEHSPECEYGEFIRQINEI